jgi:hypothetical protein
MHLISWARHRGSKHQLPTLNSMDIVDQTEIVKARKSAENRGRTKKERNGKKMFQGCENVWVCVCVKQKVQPDSGSPLKRSSKESG